MNARDTSQIHVLASPSPQDAFATEGSLALAIAPSCTEEALFFGGPAPTAAHLRSAWLPAEPAGLPLLRQLSLPGPRRKKKKRGSATAVAVTITILIRCPLLDRVGELFPTPEKKVGRPTAPGRYWLFYVALARELASFEQADEEILSHYELVQSEFAARGLRLPRLHPAGYNPVPGYAGFNNWRKAHVYPDGKLEQMLAAFRQASVELAWLIRDAEGMVTGDPLNPSLGEILCGDASLFAPPSDVHWETVTGADGKPVVGLVGSRALRPENARTHLQGGNYKKVKKHGPTKGFYHLALTCKGYDKYTRVVLDVDIARPGQAESNAAAPMLHRLLAEAPGYFRAVAYDGQILPKHALELLKRHGVYVVNHNSAKSTKPGKNHDAKRAGETVRQHGQHRGKKVRTFTTSLPSMHHERPDGTLCTHHLVSDDGAVYSADRAAGAGTAIKGELLPPTALRRLRGESRYHVDLEYTVPCPHGDLTYRARLTDTKPAKDGGVSWSSPLGAHRVIPEAWAERFKAVFGARNQVESFFSWLEKRYYHKDRVVSWGHDAQLLDLLGAAMLHNAEAWAHYVHNHGH